MACSYYGQGIPTFFKSSQNLQQPSITVNIPPKVNLNLSRNAILLSIFHKCRTSNSLNVIHLNAQSLFAHIDDFRADLSHRSIDIVLISETWLKTWHTDNMISTTGYRVCRNDRPDCKRGGGVAILYKKLIKCAVICKSSYSINSCEYLLCEISNKFEKLLIGCVYKPPNCYSLDNFYEQLQVHAGRYRKILIGGDFNINILLSNSVTNDYIFRISSFGLSFANTTEPTHFALASSASLLDHFLISDVNFINMYQQLSAPAYSHHDILFLDIEFKTEPDVASTYSYRNFKAINDDLLCSDLQEIDWSHALQYPLDSSIDFLESKINGLYDSHVPLVTKKISSIDNIWMTSEIRQLRNQRDYAYAEWKQHRHEEVCAIFRQRYNSLRNLVTLKIRSAKTNYFNRKLTLQQPSKDLWKQLRLIGVAEKANQSCELDPDSLINSFFPFYDSSTHSDLVIPQKNGPDVYFP